MNIDEFESISLNNLAGKSQMDKTRWCKYFNGQSITETVLNRVAKRLEMQPHALLEAINKRRLQNYAINARVDLVA